MYVLMIITQNVVCIYAMREGFHRRMQHYLNGDREMKCNVIKLGNKDGCVVMNLNLFFRTIN